MWKQLHDNEWLKISRRYAIPRQENNGFQNSHSRMIVFGFISGIHYCLIGLIRKRHDCITNSTRGCQDGFISIPEPFLEKHLVISVW